MKRFVTALAVAVLMAGGVAGAQTPAEQLQRAIYLEQTVGDVAQAVALYRRILEVAPPESEVAATARRRLAAATARPAPVATPVPTTPRTAQQTVVATETPAAVRRSTRTASDWVWFQTLPADTIVVGNNGPVLSESTRVMALGLTLREIVGFAYNNGTGALTRSQVIGGPAWMDTARWDIRVPVPSNVEALQYDSEGVVIGGAALAGLQQLLAGTFGLQVHPETRAMPLYDMVSNGPGPDLKPSTANCASPEPRELCEWRAGPGFMTARGKPMRHLAVQLSWNFPAITRPVRDRSGLTGKYDYTVAFTPTLLVAPNRQDPHVENPSAAAGPSLVQVLRDRLGLRLVETTDALDVVVIDNVQMPQF